MKSVHGKVVLVTGASSGLGYELVAQLLDKGARVVATFRKREEIAAYDQRHRGQGLGILVDITDEAAVKRGVAQALARFGRIDILANCAGAGTVGAVEETSDAEARRVFDLNFFGGLNMLRAVTPAMRAQRSGHLIQFSAIGGFIGYPGFGLYCAAKSATSIVGEALAAELAPFGIASTVLTIGIFETRFVGGSLTYAARMIDDYADTPAGKFRGAIGGLQGKQPNLADKGAAAIINLMEAEKPPLHAALGADATGAMRRKMALVAQGLADWRDNAASTARAETGA